MTSKRTGYGNVPVHALSVAVVPLATVVESDRYVPLAHVVHVMSAVVEAAAA